MVNITVYQYPAVGACLDCRQVFLVSDSFTRCLLCGRPPGALLPFAPPVGAPLAAPEGPPPPAEEPTHPALAYVICPFCDCNISLLTTDPDVCLFPSPPALPAEEAASVPAPTAAAASPAGPTESPPAMAHDVFGEPIEGPPVEALGPAPEEPLP